MIKIEIIADSHIMVRRHSERSCGHFARPPTHTQGNPLQNCHTILQPKCVSILSGGKVYIEFTLLTTFGAQFSGIRYSPTVVQPSPPSISTASGSSQTKTLWALNTNSPPPAPSPGRSLAPFRLRTCAWLNPWVRCSSIPRLSGIILFLPFFVWLILHSITFSRFIRIM